MTIVGAGLAGSLLAIYLAKRGLEVTVYEARGDMRKATVAAGRSINLALSDRGIAALREIGMDEYMLNEAVPMHGRMIHSVSGETKLLPYSGRQGEYINSVSRAGLNIALINEAEKFPNVRMIFNERCTDFDLKSGEITFASGSPVQSNTVIATDGAGSPIRQAIQRQMPEFEFTSVFLDHGYKELHIPPGPNGSFLLEKDALHIWPRRQFMMIALPNFDGSFTCTLFLAHEGEKDSFQEISRGLTRINADQNNLENLRHLRLSAAESLLGFFNREFPDAVPLMPTLVEDFFANPTGELGTLKCWPWSYKGKVLLLGDSAHAMVPFYGQGMNCAFEEVRTLDAILSEPGAIATGSDPDWESIFQKYSALRKPNTDAIQDMAEENFYEMRDATADPVFQRKRDLETKLEHTFPDYFSKYSMVTFREDMPYSEARRRGNAQDRLLMEISASVDLVGELNLREVMEKLNS